MSDPMSPEVREWLKRTDADPPDAHRSAGQVMARLPEAQQRRRWWPFPVLYRRTATPTTTDTAEDQNPRVPAPNARPTTVIGRTQTMFSPAKAITASVIVFAIGGAFLIAQPFERQGSVPGAETEAFAPTRVTGDIQPAPSCSSPDFEVDGDVRRSRNGECSPQTWTSSDPRLTGEVSNRWNEDTYQTDEGSISVGMDTRYLRNDDGGWACSYGYLVDGSGQFADPLAGSTSTYTCTGDGGYAGLSAILVLEDTGGFSADIVGLIFPGDLPPLPEPPAAE
jgi:hypothetical protein